MKIIIRYALFLTLFFNLGLFGQDQMESLLKQAESLKTASVISVSVGGDFFINGTFSAFATERLDHFITRVLFASIGGNNGDEENNPTPSEQLNTLLAQTNKRNIKLINNDGQSKIIDLEKFYLTGDITQNPYLKMDDMIIFNKINLETNYVIVDGAVSKRLKFTFVDGDKLSDALMFSHGVDPAYENVKFAEIIRKSFDGNSTQIDTVDLNYAATCQLKAGDIVRVIADNYERKDFKVLVVGEVGNPGYVYISKDQTTLREVINKAGGFKKTASLKFSELVRANTPENKVLQELIISSYENGYTDKKVSEAFRPNAEWENWKMFRTANLNDDHNSIFRLDAQLALIDRNNLVDFTALENNNSNEFDFIVKDGDVIYVSEEIDHVYVMGQVVNPGYYPHNGSSKYMDYIIRAGGFSDAAECEIYVVKGKSYNWVEADDYVNIEPGDYIWVKKDPARSFNFYLTRVSAVTGIIGSIATIILLIRSLYN